MGGVLGRGESYGEGHSWHRTKAIEPWGGSGLPLSLSVTTCSIIWSDYIAGEYTLLLLVESEYENASKRFQVVSYNTGNQGDARGWAQRAGAQTVDHMPILRDLCPADRGRVTLPVSLLDEG